MVVVTYPRTSWCVMARPVCAVAIVMGKMRLNWSALPAQVLPEGEHFAVAS